MIKNNVSEKNYICRCGVDEFLIIFVNCSESLVYKRIAFMRRMAESNLVLSNGEKITMSFGISTNDDNSLEELIEEADEALYQSKDKGKNQITKYKAIDKVKKI